MKSESEEFCKSCFDKYVRERFPHSNISWDDVERRCEPPDFYLTVDSEKYAVEVTILIPKADVGTKNALPSGIVRDCLNKFIVDDIETTAKENRCLNGTYLVIFSKPISNFVQEKAAIKEALLVYICDTQEVSKAQPKTVYECGRQKCTIEKTHLEEDKVVMGPPYIGRRGDEAIAEGQKLLNDRLDEKEYRLRKVKFPKILLLHDKYHFADFQVYRKHISMAPSVNSFQTVFVVESSERCFILYSKDPAWKLGSH